MWWARLSTKKATKRPSDVRKSQTGFISWSPPRPGPGRNPTPRDINNPGLPGEYKEGLFDVPMSGTLVMPVGITRYLVSINYFVMGIGDAAFNNTWKKHVATKKHRTSSIIWYACTVHTYVRAAHTCMDIFAGAAAAAASSSSRKVAYHMHRYSGERSTGNWRGFYCCSL